MPGILGKPRTRAWGVVKLFFAVLALFAVLFVVAFSTARDAACVGHRAVPLCSEATR